MSGENNTGNCSIWLHVHPIPKPIDDNAPLPSMKDKLPEDWFYDGNEIFVGRHPDDFDAKFPMSLIYVGPIESKSKAMEGLQKYAEENIESGFWKEFTFMSRNEYLLQK
jgi:hypothetical protein